MNPGDRLVARIAVERGWVTESAVERVLAELTGEAAAGSLVAALRARGLVNESQQRVLAHEQSRRERLTDRYSDIRRADSVLGEKLLARGAVAERSLEEGFYVQGAERLRGRVRRLGDILVERGTIGRDELVAALKDAGVGELLCAACEQRAPADALGVDEPLTCPACGGPMVDDTTFAALRRERPAVPDEARIAEQMTERDYGKFVLVQHLGSGGMGAVWKAWDRELGRWVALKLLRSVSDKRDEDSRRFAREAMMAARLRHPNIVSVHESVEVRGQPVIVMEYVDGKPLNHLRLGPRQALEVIRDAARGVQYAHDQGIVHRDLKPGNIMMTADRKVFVMDFGLARSLAGPSTLTETGFVLGTPMYMPPEQARAQKDRDEKLCDVYALGATLYDCLTGRPPFEAEQPWDVIADVLHTDPVPAQRRNPEVPRDAATIVQKAMHKIAGARYKSAGALADDIERFLTDKPIVARPTPLAEKAWRWLRRRWVVVAAAAAVLAVAAAGVVAVSVSRGRDARKRDADAQAHVDRARTFLGEYRAGRTEAAGLRAKQATVSEEAQPEEGRTLKHRIEAIERQLDERFINAMQECAGATSLVPGHGAAGEVIGDLWWERHLLAEERGEDLSMTSTIVRTMGSARHVAELDAPAKLTLGSSPEGAHVEYRAYEADERGVLVAGAPRLLGRTPLRDVALPKGSGLLVLRQSGRVDTRLPVFARRGEALKGFVRLLAASEIPSGFVHVPAGPVRLGGDPLATRARPAHDEDVGDFLIARHEVTVREYLEYLNDLPAHEAEQRVPKQANRTPLMRLGANGEWTGGAPDLPVQCVRWEDATAYCEWRARKEGRAVRLPTRVEWEKAARGADGRGFPWGNQFDWSFTYGGLPGNRFAGKVGDKPTDESPYGARDMAGNVAEWCQERVGEHMHLARGGWYYADIQAHFRCASQHQATDALAVLLNGFRVVIGMDE